MPSASARRFGRTTTSRARTAATGTAWRRARIPNLMFAELLGKEAGYCKGKGGSMHIADPATGNLGANAIVGGSAGIATGAAFSSKYLKNGQVAVCFFGEGALGQGLLYEEMNLAQLWKLPVIFVVREQRLQRVHALFGVHGRRRQRACRRFRHGQRDGRWPERSRRLHTWRRSTSSGRATGDGPAFLQFKTYRYHGHHVGDIARAYYRPKAEEQEWVTQRDPDHAARRVAHGQRRGRPRSARCRFRKS